MQRCLYLAHKPGLNCGGGGDAGTPGHQFGFGAGVEAAVGCCALTGVTSSAAPIATKITMAAAFTKFISLPITLANWMLRYDAFWLTGS
jgi:hypothetical protein